MDGLICKIWTFRWFRPISGVATPHILDGLDTDCSGFGEFSVAIIGERKSAASRIRSRKPARKRVRGRRGRHSGYMDLGVEYRTHPDCQTFAAKRLFEQLDVGVEPALMDNGVLRVSGHEQDPDVGHHHPCLVG